MKKTFLMTIIFLLAIPASSAWAIRLKEVVTFEGVRPNQIFGYGLVVGLNGTGDKDKVQITNQGLANMMERMGMTVDPGQMKVKNVAAVMVTADLPPFVKPGSKIDVVVSSMGDSTSLQGGTLQIGRAHV